MIKSTTILKIHKNMKVYKLMNKNQDQGNIIVLAVADIFNLIKH